MDPLLPSLNNGTDLSVTVPANAPAGTALDIIVTDPNTNDPPDQQNQSGVLAGQFDILPNPKFQPADQFATVNLDGSASIYSVTQQTIANVAMPGGSLAPAFNIDGKDLYIAGGVGYENDVFPVNLANNQVAAPIPICSTNDCLYSNLVAGSRDPSTGKPVIDYVLWNYSSQIQVYVVDSNPNSPTFNTVIRSFSVGNNVGYVNAMAVSPDGKYCYVSYDEYLGIVDLSNGQFISIANSALGVAPYQYQVGISPDGKFLLYPATLDHGIRSRSSPSPIPSSRNASMRSCPFQYQVMAFLCWCITRWSVADSMPPILRATL